jgi:hypothetical protein
LFFKNGSAPRDTSMKQISCCPHMAQNISAVAPN